MRARSRPQMARTAAYGRHRRQCMRAPPTRPRPSAPPTARSCMPAPTAAAPSGAAARRPPRKVFRGPPAAAPRGTAIRPPATGPPQVAHAPASGPRRCSRAPAAAPPPPKGAPGRQRVARRQGGEAPMIRERRAEITPRREPHTPDAFAQDDTGTKPRALRVGTAEAVSNPRSPPCSSDTRHGRIARPSTKAQPFRSIWPAHPVGRESPPGRDSPARNLLSESGEAARLSCNMRGPEIDTLLRPGLARLVDNEEFLGGHQEQRAGRSFLGTGFERIHKVPVRRPRGADKSPAISLPSSRCCGCLDSTGSFWVLTGGAPPAPVSIRVRRWTFAGVTGLDLPQGISEISGTRRNTREAHKAEPDRAQPCVPSGGVCQHAGLRRDGPVSCTRTQLIELLRRIAAAV